MSVLAKLVISSGDVWLGIYDLHKSCPALHLPAAPVSFRSRRHTAGFLRPLGSRTTTAEVFAYLTDFIHALVVETITYMLPACWTSDILSCLLFTFFTHTLFYRTLHVEERHEYNDRNSSQGDNCHPPTRDRKFLLFFSGGDC